MNKQIQDINSVIKQILTNEVKYIISIIAFVFGVE